jgi:hypothetical protein
VTEMAESSVMWTPGNRDARVHKAHFWKLSKAGAVLNVTVHHRMQAGGCGYRTIKRDTDNSEIIDTVNILDCIVSDGCTT